jgi:arylsulfatase A-like enzyme
VPHDPPERLLARVPLESVPIPDWFEGDEVARAAFRERERTLLAMEAWLDEGVAELQARLRALDALDNTLFVFLVDNGWANGCVSKGWAYDKGLRTPMILGWPKGIPAGVRYSHLVSPVDLYATILDYAGAPIPSHSEGHSLRPLLEGKPYSPREALYGALYPLEPTEVVTDPARDAYALWARTERWKLILTLKDVHAAPDAPSEGGEREDIKVSLAPAFTRKRGDLELYDLLADPHERSNLALHPDQAALLERVRSDLRAWLRATGGGAFGMP